MSEPRYRVTIHDRQTNKIQQYDVERVVQMLSLPHNKGEAWMISFRNVDNNGIAEAIAVLLDRVYELSGTDALDQVEGKLGRVPVDFKTIDYTKEG